MKYLTLFLLSLNLFAKGPFPHERTDTPKKGNANIGRFMYVGDVPKFSGRELEIVVSKMSLTTRVKALVTQEKIDQYAKTLFDRWFRIDSAFLDPKLELHPLIKLEELKHKNSANTLAWIKTADQYTKHILEMTSTEIYASYRGFETLFKENEHDSYKDNISRAIIEQYFQRDDISPELLRADNSIRDELISVTNSRKLFEAHFNDIFTKTQDKNGSVGFLTFVYPIAATTAGPFDQPKEQITDLKTANSMEARWWSDKWNDEFGGFPFLLIEWSGVAFHGPITTYGPLDVWYLRRGYFSHGCHRMDSSDILEFRALMPSKMKESKDIKVTILNYFDVTDWNNDGLNEVIDVKYYNIPSNINVAKGKTIDQAIAPYKVENQMKSFYSQHAYAKSFYDVQNDKILKAPKYKKVAGKLVREGTHESLPLYRFEYRGNRILQYEESGIRLQGFDDVSGKYPPVYFQK